MGAAPDNRSDGMISTNLPAKSDSMEWKLYSNTTN